MFRRLILGGLLLSACGVDLQVAPGTEILCVSQDDCPRGLTCNAGSGRCVSDDVAGPLLVEGVAATSSFRVLVTFNKQLAEDMASDLTHYAVAPGITVDGMRLSDDHKTVTLFTSEMKAKTYTLRLTGLADVFGYAMADTSVDFPGIGDLVDPTPPQLLAPVDTANFAGATSIELQWTPVRNAKEYFVTVTLDAAMSVPHPSAPADGYFRTSEPVLTLPLTSEQAYFWHVTSDASLDRSVIGRFATVANEVLVYCPEDVADCVDGPVAPQWEAGTRDSPFYSPARAINASARFGANTVKVAGRGDRAYNGGIVLVRNLKVSGGWDPTFNTRDRNMYPTRLSGSTRVVQVIKTLNGVRKPPDAPPDDAVTVEGFTIEGQTNVVTLASCDHGVIFRDNIVRGAADRDALVIDSSETLGPNVEDCDITGGVSIRANAGPTFRRDVFIPVATGVPALDYREGMRGVIEHSFINGAGIKGAAASQVVDIRITDNAIGSPGQRALYIDGIVDGLVLFANNLVVSGDTGTGESDTTGVVFDGSPSPTNPTTPKVLLVHNTMLALTGSARGFVVRSKSVMLSAVNNLFGCLGNGANSGVDFDSDMLDIAALQNNAFAGCTHAVRFGASMVGGTYDDDASLAALHMVEDRNVTGNVVSSLALTDVLVDGGGTDASYLTLSNGRQLDGNWRPRLDAVGTLNHNEQLRITAGGKVTYNEDCGLFSESFTCGGIATDYANVTRGNPTAIGAYERGP